ncbi:sensor histidine kinase [Paenibacillus sp. GCM10023252]|uniref:sensor histidine kinase n=1 Tax=Paenibacillus sp. GCM10023252 TaxID=3252649 RepID=UPI003617C3C8
MQRNIWPMAIIVIVVLLLINSTAYYFLTKRSLEQALSREMLTVAKQIELSVEQSRLGAEKFEEEIGRELRAAAVAASYALNPDIEQVTNDQLKALSKKLGVEHITLLKQTEDDIILYKSSDPNELGKSTKSWDPWHQVFRQLFAKQNVSIDWLGQTLPNFWSGPFEFATTSPTEIYKWGFYHDGSTNYIINPFVNYERLSEYQTLTGVSRLIGETIKSNKSLLEVGVLNPKTFAKGRTYTKNPDGQNQAHILQDPVVFGTYDYEHSSDIASVKKAYENGQIVMRDEKVHGLHVFKMFIPVTTANAHAGIVDENGTPMKSYVLSIVSDYQIIQDQLDAQFLNIGIIIVIITLLSILAAIVAMRYLRQSRDRAVRVTQETYVDEINQMFHSIRAQRHDFINHVQTIHSLAELQKTQELAAYTKELTGEIRLMNDIINIGNPAIAALIRSKISQAESLHVSLVTSFSGMNKLEMGVKTLDLTRILGNLIDNAFDEVMKYPEVFRKVIIMGKQTDGNLEFTVSNTCNNAQALITKPLFNEGFSTKSGEHQGLGLSIVKSIVEKYRGTVGVTMGPTPDEVTFTVNIPH